VQAAKEGEKKSKLVVAPWLVLLPIALFSVLAIRDYKAEAAARWQTAEKLAAGGVKREDIDAGFEWLGWYLFQEGADYIRSTNDYSKVGFPPRAVSTSDYLVTELPNKGYTQLEQVPYDSWLEGGQIRDIVVLEKK
jgi:hypothetical protein